MISSRNIRINHVEVDKTKIVAVAAATNAPGVLWVVQEGHRESPYCTADSAPHGVKENVMLHDPNRRITTVLLTCSIISSTLALSAHLVKTLLNDAQPKAVHHSLEPWLSFQIRGF